MERNISIFITKELWSETDSELIVQLIAEAFPVQGSLMAATLSVLSTLRGTWGLCIIDSQNPHQMLIARNGSSLHIGFT